MEFCDTVSQFSPQETKEQLKPWRSGHDLNPAWPFLWLTFSSLKEILQANEINSETNEFL